MTNQNSKIVRPGWHTTQPGENIMVNLEWAPDNDFLGSALRFEDIRSTKRRRIFDALRQGKQRIAYRTAEF